MPSLVREAFTSLPPVSLITVSDRAMRGRAASTSASHSSSDSRPPKTTTRGLCMVSSTFTSRSCAHSVLGDPASAGSGTRTGGGRPWATGSAGAWLPRKDCSVWVSASSATSSSQPLLRMAASTASGRQPAWACSMIH